MNREREREKHKREQAKFAKLRELEKNREKEELEKLCAKREQEKKEIKEKKKREEEEKEKEESITKVQEENERKELEAKEKIRQESELERQTKVVELTSISNEKRELMVRDLVFHPSPIPSIKSQFQKGVYPCLNSSHFFIKSFVLFSSKKFCSPSHSLISSFSKFCVKTNFDFITHFKIHLSQSVRHYKVGWISPFSNFNNPFSHIAQSILLHGHYDFIIILFDDYCRFIFDPGGIFILVLVSLSPLDLRTDPLQEGGDDMIPIRLIALGQRLGPFF